MNPQSEAVFLDRYALKDADGNLLETEFHQLTSRLSHKFAKTLAEHSYFRNVLNEMAFVPGGRILADAGADSTLFNCFVIPLKDRINGHGDDSRTAIMCAATDMIEICARGGGVGINWSTLRPSGAHIAGVNGKSSGSTAWMQGVDALADQIRQGGTRTAALMWMLNDWHPDIVEFCNRTERFKRANYSVGISDAFMNAVEVNDDWHLYFPDTKHPFYNDDWNGDMDEWTDTYGEMSRRYYSNLRARDLFDQMCESAGRLGSPGMVFLDTANRMSNTWYLEKLIGTNPCGEQVLPPYGSCNLGAINLVKMWDPVIDDIDYNYLGETIDVAVRFLDRVTDVSKDVLNVIGDQQRATRRIGLGTMGLADVLIMKKIRYGSEESLAFIDKLYAFIRDEAYKSSINLAVEFGSAPALNIDKFLESGFMKTMPSYIRESISNVGIRNLALLSQAPTGTTSILAGVSSGIEPIFASEYIRKDATGTSTVIHPLFKDDYGEHLVTAHGVSFRDHIEVQARVQQYMDSAVSKTINLPPCSSIADIGEAYMLAWNKGCKGITVYVDGSGEGVCEVCKIN